MAKQTYAGTHSLTAAVKNVLAAKDVVAPHTGQPFTEAMLLGIGGGLGAGYILWEFKREAYAIIVLGFRNRWNYPVDYLTNLCQRIGARVEVKETTGKKAAAQNLEDGLKDGPVIAWVDKAHLPYQHLPESLKGYVVHVVAIHNLTGESASISDLSSELFSVPLDDLAAGRGRISSDKNRVMTITPPERIDLEVAVMAGIADCVEHLGRSSESFALPVYKKWAKMMTDPNNKKGWPTVFKERKGLYSTLRSIYEGIVLDDTDGHGLRRMYADFLNEAGDALNKPALKTAAEQYATVAGLWSQLADAALPQAQFKETRELLHQRYDSYCSQNFDDLAKASDKLFALRTKMDRDFPMGDAEVTALFEDLSSRLEAIYESENAALEVLRASV